MYEKKSGQNLLESVITAGLGSGVVTFFAITQGQNTLLAIAITIFSILVALIVNYLTDMQS
jgi:predicted signal transduction protein with EAL and GGDEF domain